MRKTQQKLFKFGIAGIVSTHKIKITCHLYRTVNSKTMKAPPKMLKLHVFSVPPNNFFFWGNQYIVRYSKCYH